MIGAKNPNDYFTLAAVRPDPPKGSSGMAGRTRIVLAVGPHESGWGIDRDGEWVHPCASREEAKAAANKMARDLTDTGHPCRVLVHGESGHYARQD